MTLENRNVVVKFGEFTALHPFEWGLEVGKHVALVGPNGSGKSTLLRALSGILEPAHGSVFVDGIALATLPRIEAARRIAYLPQSSSYTFSMTVDAFVALGFHPELGRFSALTDAQKRRRNEALDQFDVAAHADRPIHELSGGELQRVRLARTAVSEAPYLLLDEPTAPLDPKYVTRFYDFMRSNTSRGLLVAIHDLSSVDGFFDEVLVLRDGEEVASGPPDVALTESLVSEVYGVTAEAVEHGSRRFWRFGVAIAAGGETEKSDPNR
jgi:iron complex transport system ATP-binding protein